MPLYPFREGDPQDIEAMSKALTGKSREEIKESGEKPVLDTEASKGATMSSTDIEAVRKAESPGDTVDRLAEGKKVEDKVEESHEEGNLEEEFKLPYAA